MTKEEDFKLLKIQTCVLKVNIHCDGCKQKVKKLLQRIEGVYQVNIDAEHQKVTVSGTVGSATLIKKLVRAGKHAEIWSSQKSNQNQNQKNNCIKDDKNNKSQKQNFMKGLEVLKNQQKFPAFSPLEDDDYYDDDEVDEDGDEDDDELGFLRGSQLGLLRQQAIDANNAKKNIAAIAAAASGSKMQNNVGNGNVGKKGNPTQNMQMKVNNPGGIDQKTMAALKMNSAQLGGGNANETNRGNDISTMMKLAGFHGNNGGNYNLGNGGVLRGNPNVLGGFQVQPNNGYHQGSYATAAATAQQYPSPTPPPPPPPSSLMMNMNNNNYINPHHPAAASMMMNMQNGQLMQQHQQPLQMMYQRSPFIPPSTSYYYHNYNFAPYPYTDVQQPNHSGDHSAAAATAQHMFSDENTSSSCSIM